MKPPKRLCTRHRFLCLYISPLPFIVVLILALKSRSWDKLSVRRQEASLGALHLSGPELSELHNRLLSMGLGSDSADEVQSVTVLLPVSSKSLAALDARVDSLTAYAHNTQGIIVLCPDSLLVETRRLVRRIVSTPTQFRHPEISIHSWAPGIDGNLGLLHAASKATAKYVIFLEESGLDGLDVRTQRLLFSMPSPWLPVGPRGAVVQSQNASCLFPSSSPQAASYVVPPFVVSLALLQSVAAESKFLNSWRGFGSLISNSRSDRVGGIVIGYEHAFKDWCSAWDAALETNFTASDGFLPPTSSTLNEHVSSAYDPVLDTHPTHIATFAVLFPSLRDLDLFSTVPCRLQSKGYIVKILLYDEFEDLTSDSNTYRLILNGCQLHYDTATPDDILYSTLRREDTLVMDWLDAWDDGPDVIIALAEPDGMTSSLAYMLEGIGPENTTLVQIPRSDLRHSEWMGSLSAAEWSNWHVPEIDISIITSNRPRSLARLISSLSRSLFFGDRVNVRINLEYPTDAETLHVVDHFSWEHGDVSVFRRIVHAGLLPAVVESWYPHSDDSYGLLLEDDIEVSPLFYAWVKMAILRYRYGLDTNKSIRLFGVSLYQQKNLELGMQGRRPFNAQAFFFEHGLPYPSTPYLSQIPCSWGAAYFPEHWREFHSYLTGRLSESTYPLDQAIVPDVRSNRWKKSWKKYFIEMVYLKGYVMLYPNYDGFVSLSTNHLELGSHVKAVSKEKQDLFLLPLMQLPSDDDGEAIKLTDLPRRELPAWNALPVLNLTGAFTSLEAQMGIGARRHAELARCVRRSPFVDKASQLVCTANHGFTPVD